MDKINLRNQLISQLYQHQHSALLHWFQGKLQHRAQAEDLSQEVFYRLLKKPKFQQIQEPKAWLLGIAKHVLVDHWRRQYIENLYKDSLLQLAEQYHPSAEHESIIQESLYQLQQLLEQMPKRRAEIFLYSQLDGLNYLQIAAQLNISESTVKREIRAAFLQCMHLYEQLDD